jgi:hypothetical protein
VIKLITKYANLTCSSLLCLTCSSVRMFPFASSFISPFGFRILFFSVFSTIELAESDKVNYKVCKFNMQLFALFSTTLRWRFLCVDGEVDKISTKS